MTTMIGCDRCRQVAEGDTSGYVPEGFSFSVGGVDFYRVAPIKDIFDEPTGLYVGIESRIFCSLCLERRAHIQLKRAEKRRQKKSERERYWRSEIKRLYKRGQLDYLRRLYQRAYSDTWQQRSAPSIFSRGATTE